GSGQVHGEVQLPVLVLHVLELRHRVDEAGVVHADVDGSEVALDPAHELLHLGRLADVARVALRAPARRRDLVRGLGGAVTVEIDRSEEHTSELQSRGHLVCRLLLEKKKYQSKLWFLMTGRFAPLTPPPNE